MKIVLLDADTLGDDISLEPIKRLGELEIYSRTLPEEIKKRVAKADIIITNKVVINREIMQNAPELKLISVAATGVNNVDLESAKEFNIEVKNVTGYSTSSVVQHTFAMLFYLIESSSYYDSYVKSKEWSEDGLFTHLKRPFFEIMGKSWGIIGLGTIGKEVARVASSFGAKVSYYSTNQTPHSEKYPHKSLEELLRSSDIISIHSPLNEKTANLIGERKLNLLKDRAVLLNLGRGGIVDEVALAKKIDSSNILVGVDVTSKEPLPADSPLLNLNNKEQLFITPHIAWASIEARERLIAGVAKGIEEFLAKNN